MFLKLREVCRWCYFPGLMGQVCYLVLKYSSYTYIARGKMYVNQYCHRISVHLGFEKKCEVTEKLTKKK